MLTPEHAVLMSILVCIAGAVGTPVFCRSRALAGWYSLVIVAISAVLVLYAAALVLTVGPSEEPASVASMPALGFVLRLYVDGLSSIFLLLAAVVAVPASLYSIRYMAAYTEYRISGFYPYFLLFLAAMYGLISTTDMMWFFCIFWQMMTLPGYMLIRFESRNPGNLRAANRYLVMMQIACAATMIGAEVLAAGSPASAGQALKYDFDSISAAMPAVISGHPAAASIAFILFLVGFGIKMGMWPFGQMWLPDAHPAAPSPVSAMLSGVMIKTGVYGLMRYFLWLVPVSARDAYPLSDWGMAISLLGTITLFTGTMQALRQNESKRLLAYSSIGQVGYILLGLGACMALMGEDYMALASIAFAGVVLHVLNHGLFKALLFLNAGSILHATGTQDLNKLGGLARLMPVTAVTAGVGSLAISGVPLFNGFISKWCIFASSIQGGAAGKYLPMFAAVAILTSALTLAAFIKSFGVSFLSRTSDLVEKKIGENGRLEVSPLMHLPQSFLAVLCVILGIVPVLGFAVVRSALNASQAGVGGVLARHYAIEGSVLTGIEGKPAQMALVPLAVALVLALLFFFARAASKWGAAPRRSAAPWLCGYVTDRDCYRYSSHQFYLDVKRRFWWLGGGRTSRVEKEVIK